MRKLSRTFEKRAPGLKMIPIKSIFTAVPGNCAETYRAGHTKSGVYTINPDGSGEFDVFCDQETDGGGWTVFQKRMDGSVDFYRDWESFKNGFGNLNSEFWLGLDKIHLLTNSHSVKLRVDLEDWEGETRFAEYGTFTIANEKDKYKLSVGSYTGDSDTRFALYTLNVF